MSEEVSYQGCVNAVAQQERGLTSHGFRLGPLFILPKGLEIAVRPGRGLPLKFGTGLTSQRKREIFIRCCSGSAGTKRTLRHQQRILVRGLGFIPNYAAIFPLSTYQYQTHDQEIKINASRKRRAFDALLNFGSQLLVPLVKSSLFLGKHNPYRISEVSPGQAELQFYKFLGTWEV